MAVRSVVINLSADVTNFRMQIRNAANDLTGAASTMRNNMQRIETQSKLLTAQLENTGTAFQKLSIDMDAQKAALQQQTMYTDQVKAKYDSLSPTLARTDTEFRKLELALLKASLAEQTMINNLELIQRELTMVGNTEGLTKIANQVNLASIATNQLVANLGTSANQLDVYRAKMAGLTDQVRINQQQQTLLTETLAKATTVYGAGSAEVAKYKQELAAAKLAGTEMANSIQQLQLNMANLNQTNAATLLAEKFTMLRNTISLAELNARKLIYSLGPGADAVSVVSAKIAGLNTVIVAQEREVVALTLEYNRLRVDSNSTALAISEMAVRLKTATVAFDELKFKSKELEAELIKVKQQAAMAPNVEALTRLRAELEKAAMAGKQLAADLGASANQLDVYRVNIASLTTQLAINQQLQATLAATVVQSVGVFGVASVEVAKYRAELAAARLAGTEMANNIQQLNLNIASLGQNNAAVALAEKFKLLRNAVEAAQMNTKLMVYALGPAAAEMDRLRATLAGTEKEFMAQRAEVRKLAQELMQLQQNANSTAVDISNMGNKVLSAKVQLASLEDTIRRLRLEMAKLRNDSQQAPITANLANLKHQMEMAALATKQGVANLSFNAPASLVNTTRMTGLNEELVRTRAYHAALEAEMRRVGVQTATNAETFRVLERELRTTSLQVRELEVELERLRTVSGEVNGLLSIMSGTALTVGLMFTTMVTYPIMRATSAGLDFNAMIESATTQFRVLYDSMDRAVSLMDKLQTFAKLTPFETEDLTKQSAILGQFGVSLRNIMPMIKILGDISGGNKERFGVIAYNFAQITALGKLTGRDVMSIAQQGFSVPKWIARLRISKGNQKSETRLINEITKPGGEMERSLISAREVAEAMQFATSKGQTFFNMMNEKSKTYEGQMSTVRDNWKMLVGALTKPIFNTLAKFILPAINNMMSFLRVAAEANPIFAGIVLTIGSVTAAIGPLLVATYGLIKVVGYTKVAYGFLKLKAVLALTAIKNLTLQSAFATSKLVAELIFLGATIGMVYTITRNWGEFTTWAENLGVTVRAIVELTAAYVDMIVAKLAVGVANMVDGAKNKIKELPGGKLLFTEPKPLPERIQPTEMDRLKQLGGNMSKKETDDMNERIKAIEAENAKINRINSELAKNKIKLEELKKARSNAEMQSNPEQRKAALKAIDDDIAVLEALQKLGEKTVKQNIPKFDSTDMNKNLKTVSDQLDKAKGKIAESKATLEAENKKELAKFVQLPLTPREQYVQDAVSNYEDAVRNLNRVLTLGNDQQKKLGKDVVNNWIADIAKLKDTFKTQGLNTDDWTTFLDDFAGTTEDAADKLKDAADKSKSFIQQLIDQARQFANAMGLYDKAIVDKISPERLYIRLKGQLKMMQDWGKHVASLKGKLGTDSMLFQEVVKKGPTAEGAGLAKALDSMGSVMLGGVNAMKDEMFNLGLDPSIWLEKAKLSEEKKVNNVVINIMGGVIVDNMEDLLDKVTTHFRRKGFA